MVVNSKKFSRPEPFPCAFPNIWILQKSGFHAFLGISGRFYEDFRCPQGAEIQIFWLKSWLKCLLACVYKKNSIPPERHICRAWHPIAWLGFVDHRNVMDPSCIFCVVVNDFFPNLLNVVPCAAYPLAHVGSS